MSLGGTDGTKTYGQGQERALTSKSPPLVLSALVGAQTLLAPPIQLPLAQLPAPLTENIMDRVD